MSWHKRPQQDLADEPERVLAQALRYLAQREYTALELRRRLKERGAPPDAIDEALEYLQQHGYQDDARAAAAHIRQRRHFAPRGRLLVRQELRERGLAGEAIELLLDEHYPAEEEPAALRQFYGQALYTQAEDEAARRKLWLKLARRAAAKGFAQSVIIAVLGEHLPGVGEYEE